MSETVHDELVAACNAALKDCIADDYANSELALQLQSALSHTKGELT